MDWTALFLVIFSLLVVILSIANAIYFWKAYSNPCEGYSTGYALTLFITNVIMAIVALLVLFWGVYVMVTSPTVVEEVTPPLPLPTKPLLPSQPAPVSPAPLCSLRPTIRKVPSAEVLLS